MQRNLAQKEAGVAENGFTSADLAPSAFAVFNMAMHYPEMCALKWEEADHHIWDRITTRAIRRIDEAILKEETVSWTQVAQALAGWSRNLDPRDFWEGLAFRDKIAWEAVGRHLANCIDSESGSVTPAELEGKMELWIKKKLDKQGIKT